MKRFGVSMEDGLLQKLDKIVSKKGYQNRSEAIRDFIRDHLVEQDSLDPKKEVIGTLTIVYDHHAHDLSDKLTYIQHDYHKNIISSTHIHMNHDKCLEVLILKGKSYKVREIGDRLISTKGVKHGKLVITATGKI